MEKRIRAEPENVNEELDAIITYILIAAVGFAVSYLFKGTP